MYLTNKIDTAKIERLVARHGTKFFDESLQPVAPRAGQWFREFAVDTLFGGLDVMQSHGLVQYVGESEVIVIGDNGMSSQTGHLVASSGIGYPRAPEGDILILCSGQDDLTVQYGRQR